MSVREVVVLPLRRFWQRLKPILLFLDRCLVSLAVPFGVTIQPRGQRLGVLLGVYLVIYLLALLPLPVLPLAALFFGYLGVLAVGRAWVANEKLRAAIVKKLVNADPDTLPDLRGSALLSALQLLILFPLLFAELQGRFHLFDAPGDAAFWTWFAFSFESISRTILEWLPGDWRPRPIRSASMMGSLLVLVKRLTVDLILIQGIIRLFAIYTTTCEGVEALKQDADMTRRLGRRAVESLIELLDSPDNLLRQRAAQVLGELHDPRAVMPLLGRLQDADPDVRWQTASALGAFRDARAIPPLIVALQDPELSVRTTAVESLAKIGDRSAVPVLVGVVRSEAPAAVRAAAIATLERLGDRQAVEPLILALQDPEEEVRRAAAQALGALRDGRAVEPLLQAVRDPQAPAWVRYESCRALEELQDARAVSPLLEALADSDAFLRKCVIHALGKLKDRQAVAALLPALDDPSKDIREAAALALGDLRDERAAGPLTALLNDADENVRAAAAQALERLRGPVPLPASTG